MPHRLRVLLTAAPRFVAIVVAVGLAASAVAAVVAYEAGKRGGHEVVTVVIAVGAVGAAGVGLATLLDPMGVAAELPQGRLGSLLNVSLSDPESLRIDDILYASGVLLIGTAVLLGFVFTWAGVPPANPFG